MNKQRDDSSDDGQSYDFNDRSDVESNTDMPQTKSQTVIISSFEELFKIMKIKINMNDMNFFSSRIKRSPSQGKKNESPDARLNGTLNQQLFQQQQSQISMFPVLPGIFQIGSIFQPTHPFQQPSEYYSKIYKQNSVQQPPQQFGETDLKFLYQTLQQQKNSARQSPQNSGDVHLAYIFASPLMLETSEGVYHDCLPPIGFKEEFEQILLALEPDNVAFTYRYMVANDGNLRECLNDNPIGLHFAGHGFENNEKLYRQDKKGWINNRNKGDVLIFEKDDGSSSFYTEQDLQFLLQNTFRHQILEFVVVASCHSECVGKIFSNCGAKHVICIDQKKVLQDEAAIHFSKTFYGHVFGKNLSICEAFKSARDHIKKQISVAESEKFRLLLSDDHPQNCKKSAIRRRLIQGQLQYKGITPKILKLPTKVTPFISRNRDMFDVIQTLNDCNILQVFGMPGLGKSSLLKNVSNFIGERNLYRDGLIYLNLQTIKTFQEALAFIMQKFEDSIDPTYKMDNIEVQFNQSFRRQEKSRLLKQIYKKFQRFKKGLLLVLDNIDDVARDYQSDIVELLTNIVQDSTNSIKILFSSSIYLEQLENYKVKKLRSLNLEDSVELFFSKIPLQNEDLESFFEWDKLMELHQFTIEKLGEQNVRIKLCKHRVHTFKCVKDYLIQHPLFDMLGGQPLSLSLIAPLSLKFSLKQMYQQLVELPIINVFKGKIREDALILSLEFSLKILNETQEKAVELFYLIGITKEGLFEEDLDQLFEEDDTQKKLQSLVELSLVQFETFDKAGQIRRFKVSPFIDKYVEQKLNPQSKRDLHMFLATYYTNKLITLKKEFSKNKDQKALSDSLSKHEQNIIFCMKELFNIDYQRVVSPQNVNLNPQNIISSPRVLFKKGQQLIDKNLLNIGNSTLNMKSNFNFMNQLPKRTHREKIDQTPKIALGNLDQEFKQEQSFKEYFDQKNQSQTKKSQNSIKEQEQHEVDEKQNSAANFDSQMNDYLDLRNTRTNFATKTPARDYKIRKSLKKSHLILLNESNFSSNNSRQNANQEFNKSATKPLSQYTQQQFNLVNLRKKRITQPLVNNVDSSFDQLQVNQSQNQQKDIIILDSDNSNASNQGIIQQSDQIIKESEKKQYQRQLNKLQKLGKQHINKNRFDQLVNSLTMRMGNSQTDNFDKLIKKGGLNFQQPLKEQLAQLNIYEKLCYHYVTILALIDQRCQEVPKIIYSNENSSVAMDKNELIIPLSNKLLQANLKMVYIYYLLNENKYDAVNGENLEMYSLFQDINCPIGEGISLYLKAKYLQKMKRKNAYQKAEKYVIKSAQKFELCQDIDGLIQCKKLLAKIKSDHPHLTILETQLNQINQQIQKENREIQDERLSLDKRPLERNQSEDKIHNMLLNIIEYSFLQKKINSGQKSVIERVQEQNMGNKISNTQSVQFNINSNNLNSTQSIQLNNSNMNNNSSIQININNVMSKINITPNRFIAKRGLNILNHSKFNTKSKDREQL